MAVMPAARLCSIPATTLSRWNCWRADRCIPPFAATVPLRSTSKVPSSCEEKSSSSSFRARWVARSIALRVSLFMSGALLHDDFLARANEPAALLANPVERRLELLLGLDAAAEVAGKAHRSDALTIDDQA